MLRRVPLFGVLSLLAACTGSSAHKTGAQADTVAPPNVCNQADPAASFAALASASIVPPRLFGAADPSGGPWSGVTIDDLEAAFCTSDMLSEDETTVTSGWGKANAPTVVVTWSKDTREVVSFELDSGYKGTLEFKSRPTSLTDPTQPNPFGQHTYSIGVGTPVLRDGAPFLLDWTKIDPQATELFDALMFTFAPELRSTQTSCVQTQLCLAIPVGNNQAAFGVRPLGIYFTVNDLDGPQPTPSTPYDMYGFALRTTPFSQADMLLKLDDEGPIATASALGEKKKSCTVKLGMTFADFESSCVDVMNDPAANAALEQKLLHAATRVVTSTSTAALDATWTFDVTGFHPSFASERFDEQTIPATAPVNELVLDDRSVGSILNDFAIDGTLTMTATGAIYAEFGREVQAFVQANMDASLPRHSLGDPACLSAQPALGCTGIEQIVIPADPSATTDPGIQRLSVGALQGAMLGITNALRPGAATIVFCSDPGPDGTTQDQHCNGTSGLGAGGPVESPRTQIITVLGGGDETKLPAAVLDRTAYVRLWVTAVVKYLRAAPQNPTDLSDPKFDALTPSAADITLDDIQGSTLSAKYLDKLELQLDFLTGKSSQIIFR